jgi:hypothetical protein
MKAFINNTINDMVEIEVFCLINGLDAGLFKEHMNNIERHILALKYAIRYEAQKNEPIEVEMDKVCLVCGRKRESKNDILPCDYGIHDDDDDVYDDEAQNQKEGEI